MENNKANQPDKTAHMIFWPLAVSGAIFDLWSKSAVFAWLMTKPYHEVTFIPGFLKFILRENEGAAFSMASGQRVFLVAISSVAAIVVPIFFLFGKKLNRLTQIALRRITGGHLGNLYHRPFNEGRVRDFIDVFVGPKHWPTFNVADSLLCIGVGLILITVIREEQHAADKKHSSKKA